MNLTSASIMFGWLP